MSALTARRVRGPEPVRPIDWIDPRTFAWITSTDTRVVRQLEGRTFRIELRYVQ